MSELPQQQLQHVAAVQATHGSNNNCDKQSHRKFNDSTKPERESENKQEIERAIRERGWEEEREIERQ